LDIEDNPIIPIVWKGRLLLFWLRILKQTPLDPGAVKTSNSTQKLADANLKGVQADATTNAQSNVKLTVKAVLCWSEYYNGKWQPTKTSDVDRPTELGNHYDPLDGFSRSAIWLSSVEEGSDHYLRISIEGDAYSTFLLYNTHSLPAREEDVSHELSDMFIGPRYLDTHTNAFRIEYYKFEDGTTLKRPVLGNQLSDLTIETTHPLQNLWIAPFFYKDSRHVFYVTTEMRRVLINNHRGYGVAVDRGLTKDVMIPPLVFEVEPRPGPRFWGDGGPIGPDMGVVNPDPMRRFVSEDVYIDKGIGAAGSVTYGESLIGPSGKLAGVRGKISGEISGKI